MDRIEDYIRSLIKHVYLGPKEKNELRDEIRNHLLDSIKELRLQGKSEDESISIAIDRFGTEKAINTQLRSAVRSRKQARSSMLKISAVFLAVSLLLLLSSQLLELRNTRDFDRMQSQYHNQIEAKITADKAITPEDMEAFFNQNKRILRSIYAARTDSHGQTTAYLYPSNTTKEQVDEQPYISYPISMADENTSWEVRIALDGNALFSQIPQTVLLLSVICFGIYWTLYGLGNVRNAYRMGRLNPGWVVLFFTLNVFAYLLFQLEGSYRTRRLKVVA